MKWVGKDFTHSTLDEGYDFIITDKWRKKYHFKISTFEGVAGLISEAIQVIEPGNENLSRRFEMLSEFDDDVEKTEMLLKAKIKKSINQRHLKHENGFLQMTIEQQIRGTITWNDNMTDTQFDQIFSVDGKRITIENFGKLIESYGGFNFKFKIYDPSDDIE